MLAALIVATTYWQTWASAGLAARQDNAIQRVAQFQIKRGLIFAADGKTRPRDERPQEGRRADALLPHLPDARVRVAGDRLLDAELRSRVGLEHERERVPDRRRTRTSATFFDTLGDKLKGTTITGNNLVLNLRVDAAADRREHARRQVRRGGRAEPADRRGLRDGLVADATTRT